MGYDCNIYIFEDVIVDTGTGDNIQYIKDSMKKAKISVDDLSLIVNTHNHFDHIGGNRCFDLEVAMHREDAKAIEEGDKIHDFEVLHTPGHTKGGICLYNGETLISGDTVFAGGGCGRMDIGGDVNEMKKSLERLTTLDVTYLLPGHGPWVNDGSRHIKMAYNMLNGY